MRRTWAALAAIALVAAGCGSGSATSQGAPSPLPAASTAPAASPAPSAPKSLTKVVLADNSPAPLPSAAPYWAVPYGLGYFQQEGLDVKFQEAGGSSECIQLVVGGQAQFGLSNGEPVLLAVQKGAKIKSFFEQNRGYGDAMVVLQSSPIQTEEQLKAALKGGKVGVSALSSGRVPYARAFIQYLGLVPDKDVRITAVGVGAQAALALKNHQVQALVLWDGAYAQIEQAGYPLRRFHAPWEKDLFSAVIVASDQTLSQQQQMVVGFGRAIAKALLFTTTNPSAAVQVYWQEYPQTKPQPGQEESAMKQYLAQINANVVNWKVGIGPNADWGSQTAQQWEALQKFAVGVGLVPKEIDVHQYFTDQFQKEIDNFDHDAVIQQAKNFKLDMVRYRP